jgi:hypothetical protein
MFLDINCLKDASYMPLWLFWNLYMPKIALRVIYFKLVKCYNDPYTLLCFSHDVTARNSANVVFSVN